MTVLFEKHAEIALSFSVGALAEQVAAAVLRAEGWPEEVAVSVLVTDDAEIREINRAHRDIDAPTDVLSFPMLELVPGEDPAACFEEAANLDPETGELFLGDIVISAERAIRQAEEYGHSTRREFAFLVAHSMLHLLGYDHESPDEAATMEEKQEKILNEMGIPREKTCERIVVKIGSSSLAHPESGLLDLGKLEVLVRELVDLRNSGKEVILVSSGAVMVGRNVLGMDHQPESVSEKQACASIGQAKLMMIYQKLFSEYDQICGQVLLTKNTMLDDLNRFNARNTFRELLSLGVIPIVNENDTIATYEIDELSVFGDNDRLSAVVAALVEADLLILLSDIDGLYTDDPHSDPDAKRIEKVETLDEHLLSMGKDSTGSDAGTGGMRTKLSAAKIATSAGCDMVIASGADCHIIHEIVQGEKRGTFFVADQRDEFYLMDCLEKML